MLNVFRFEGKVVAIKLCCHNKQKKAAQKKGTKNNAILFLRFAVRCFFQLAFNNQLDFPLLLTGLDCTVILSCWDSVF